MNVKVNVGVPELLANESEAPPLPPNPPKLAALVVQDELDKLASNVPGVPVYGLVVMEVVPKLCW